MQKIKILTDSACDISKEDEKGLGIQVMSFPITISNKAYRERKDFTNDDFYRIMDNSKDIPVISRISSHEILQVYKKLNSEGWTDVIHVTMSSKVSPVYESALEAVGRFKSSVESGKPGPRMNIHVVDSKSISGVYGYAVMQAALKAQKGVIPDEIIDYLHEWFDSTEIHFVPMNLKYIKRSAKINPFTIFPSEVIGVKPIIKIRGGESSVVEKIRGEKNIVSRLTEDAIANMVPETPYIIVTGSDNAYAEQLAAEMTDRVGYPPEWTVRVGATVAVNIGHNVTGFIIRSKSK